MKGQGNRKVARARIRDDACVRRGTAGKPGVWPRGGRVGTPMARIQTGAASIVLQPRFVMPQTFSSPSPLSQAHRAVGPTDGLRALLVRPVLTVGRSAATSACVALSVAATALPAAAGPLPAGFGSALAQAGPPSSLSDGREGPDHTFVQPSDSYVDRAATAPAVDPTAGQPRRGDDSSTALYAGLSVVGLAGVGGAGWFAWRRRRWRRAVVAAARQKAAAAAKLRTAGSSATRPTTAAGAAAVGSTTASPAKATKR